MPKKSEKKNAVTQSNLVIRSMKPLEAVKVAKFAASIIKRVSYYSVPALKSELKKYKVTELREKIKADPLSILVALKDAKMSGFLFSQWDDSTIWLEWIGVSKEERGKGVARLLLKELEQTLSKRKAHKIWSDCRTNNHASIKLFKTMGYKKIATIPNHWFKQDYILWHKEMK